MTSNLKESGGLLDALRADPAARSLLSARHAAERLAADGWHVREGTVHSAGVADVVAGRSWRRGDFAARVQLVVRCHAGGELLFSATGRVTADSLASYCAADDLPEQRRALTLLLGEHQLDATATLADLQREAYPNGIAAIAPARVDAPPATVHATAFREPRAGAEPFARAADEAFASLDAIRHDLFARDCEILDDDLETLSTGPDGTSPAAHAAEALTELAKTCEMLHAIVLTDADLAVLSGGTRVEPAPAVRLHRQQLVNSEHAWIDIVQTDAFDRYAEAMTRYYERAFGKAKFKA